MSRLDIYNKIIILAMIVAMTSGCRDTTPPLTISFEKKTSLPGNGRASAVSFAVNGLGYVLLGRNAANVQLTDCWEYNPAQDKWQEKSSFPGKARVKATATVLNGKAYVGLGHNNNIGVYNDTSNLRDYYAYEPETDSWTRLADFPSNYADACISFAYNNVVYVGIGFSEATYGSEMWKYLPEENKWVRLNDFPGWQRFGSVVCSNDRHIYFGTGYRTGNKNDWWEYHPQSDTWTKLQSMPDKGRVNAAALCINNRFFVSTGRHFGGTLTGGHVKSDLMEYSPSTDAWYKRGEIPDGGRENAIGFVINGTGYIGFGENDERVLNDFWSFNP